MSTTTTNLGLIKPELTDVADITAMNENWDKIDEKLHKAYSDENKPTKEDVGLGNVPNVATNNQTPTYSDTTNLQTLESGEKLNVAFQKIKCAITKLIEHLSSKSNPHNVTASQVGALPTSGGALSGTLTVIDNFNVNKTYGSVEYKTYVKPINYSIESNGDYATGIIHYKGSVNDSQILFNKDGVIFRDNVNAKAYKLYGEHNVTTMRSNSLNRTTAVNSHDTNYTSYMARGESLNSADTNPTANGAIAWTYQ